jgi:hypothetical protein
MPLTGEKCFTPSGLVYVLCNTKRSIQDSARDGSMFARLYSVWQ